MVTITSDNIEEWEIDLAKLDIRYIVAQGIYGTVYRGIYDDQDVAGIYKSFLYCKVEIM